jgi:ADP-ribosyl-[dinitrogen reductase] hydrolase
MLGAIAGDIVGSVYEFNNIKTKGFEPLFAAASEFTDDTICTIAVADILLNQKNPAQTMRDWCMRYMHVGGWGARFENWLYETFRGAYGSLGNGAAMRVSPAGWLAGSLDEALIFSDRVTEITHNHPEGMKAARMTAGAVWLSKTGQSASTVRQWIADTSGYDMERTVDSIRPGYRFSERSQDCVPEALICALEADSFEDALRNAISIGGDSDTIAAIAGAVAEARFGVPRWIADQVYAKLPPDMIGILDALYRVRSQRAKEPLQQNVYVVNIQT